MNIELCPECNSPHYDTDLLVDDGGGDYDGELYQFWRFTCADCGHKWDVPYDPVLDFDPDEPSEEEDRPNVYNDYPGWAAEAYRYPDPYNNPDDESEEQT